MGSLSVIGNFYGMSRGIQEFCDAWGLSAVGEPEKGGVELPLRMPAATVRWDVPK